MATSSFGPKLWGQQLVQEKSCPPPAYGMSQEKEDDSAALAAGLAAAKALLSKGGVRVRCPGSNNTPRRGTKFLTVETDANADTICSQQQTAP